MSGGGREARWAPRPPQWLVRGGVGPGRGEGREGRGVQELVRGGAGEGHEERIGGSVRGVVWELVNGGADPGGRGGRRGECWGGAKGKQGQELEMRPVSRSASEDLQLYA